MKRTSRLSQKPFQLSSLRFQQSYISRQALKQVQLALAHGLDGLDKVPQPLLARGQGIVLCPAERLGEYIKA